MIELVDGPEILKEDKLIKEEESKTTLLNYSKLLSQLLLIIFFIIKNHLVLHLHKNNVSTLVLLVIYSCNKHLAGFWYYPKKNNGHTRPGQTNRRHIEPSQQTTKSGTTMTLLVPRISYKTIAL